MTRTRQSAVRRPPLAFIMLRFASPACLFIATGHLDHKMNYFTNTFSVLGNDLAVAARHGE